MFHFRIRFHTPNYNVSLIITIEMKAAEYFQTAALLLFHILQETCLPHYIFSKIYALHHVKTQIKCARVGSPSLILVSTVVTDCRKLKILRWGDLHGYKVHTRFLENR
jgi:hypothetical protein